MIEIKAPNKLKSIFLAGSIEQDKAVKWQEKLIGYLKECDVVFYNPRREEWDSSWDHSVEEGTNFYTQVKWELDHISNADIVVFYFDENTKSPITLLELGYILGKNEKDKKQTVLVYCPEKFYRFGNVWITNEHAKNTKVADFRHPSKIRVAFSNESVYKYKLIEKIKGL